MASALRLLGRARSRGTPHARLTMLEPPLAKQAFGWVWTAWLDAGDDDARRAALVNAAGRT